MAHPVLLFLAIVLLIIIVYWYSKTTANNKMMIKNTVNIKQSSEIDVPYPKLSQTPFKKLEPEPLSAADTSVYEVVPVANGVPDGSNKNFPKFVARKNSSRNYYDIQTPRYVNNYRDIPNPVYY